VEGELTMSRKVRERLKVVETVREKQLKQDEAARQLNLSVRRGARICAHGQAKVSEDAHKH